VNFDPNDKNEGKMSRKVSRSIRGHIESNYRKASIVATPCQASVDTVCQWLKMNKKSSVDSLDVTATPNA